MRELVLDQQAQCGCGWKGQRHYLYMAAREEMIDHAREEHGLDIKVVTLDRNEAEILPLDEVGR